MTPEEKQLLLKDLCARLPYGVKIHINSCIEEQNQMQLSDVNLESETIGVRYEKGAFRAIPVIDDEDETKVIKPYLRPMSSMTEEDRREYDKLIAKCIYDPEAYFFDNYDRLYDWLLAHHFDYRGLIEKGLALKAPDGMYKNNFAI